MGSAAERELRRAVRDTLGTDARGRTWRVARMFPATPTRRQRQREGAAPGAALGRFFEVTGYVSATAPRAQLGFELAYRLRDTPLVRTAQPDLPSSVFIPEERRARAWGRPSGTC